MDRRPILLSLLVALAAGGAAAEAQDVGTVELGAFGRYTRFSNGGVSLANRAGVGGRVGYFINPLISLEADASYTSTHGRAASGVGVSYYPFHLRALANVPMSDRLGIFLGAGLAIDKYSGVGSSQSDVGVAGIAGVRVHVMPGLALRFNATADYIVHPPSGVGRFWNFGAEGGISVRLGGHHGPPPNGDGDGDGVINSLDRCPGSPPHTAVDASGCTRRADTDGDGVIDINDLCPDTPRGAKVDANGCSGTEPKAPGAAPGAASGATPGARADTKEATVGDRDGDGIADSADKCPRTASGVAVDTDGCAVAMDADGDGVMDDRDRCPSSRSGEVVDATGCRPLFGSGEKVLVLPAVTFTQGSTALGMAARQSLFQVAQSLAAHPDVAVEVAGFADERPAAEAQRLSNERARTVRDFLLANGVAPAQISAKGYGREPGTAGTRRVELRAK